MHEGQADLALYIINHKIAKEIKENTEHDYKKIKEKIQKLEKEKQEIYRGNKEIINKAINEYAKDVKINK